MVTPVYNTDSRSREKPSKADSESLRICDHCRNMLEYRRRLQVDQMVQPLICQLYSHLRKLKSQIEPSLEQYYKVIIIGCFCRMFKYGFLCTDVQFTNIW